MILALLLTLMDSRLMLYMYTASMDGLIPTCIRCDTIRCVYILPSNRSHHIDRIPGKLVSPDTMSINRIIICLFDF